MDGHGPEGREGGVEYRLAARRLEVRERAGAGAMLFGYAAVFNEHSVDLGGFVEVIMPGAFGEALKGDVRALWQHDTALVLGRTVNETLRLAEDEVGLRCEIDLPETSWAADALVNLRRGDVDQMSFGFSVPPGGDTWRETPDGWLRTIWRVDPLYEVSPVTFAAYPQTSVQARNQLAALRAQAAGESIAFPGQEAGARAAARQRDLALRVR